MTNSASSLVAGVVQQHRYVATSSECAFKT